MCDRREGKNSKQCHLHPCYHSGDLGYSQGWAEKIPKLKDLGSVENE